MFIKDNIVPNLALREDFKTSTTVAANGITIVGTPTIDNGISGFSATDYLEFAQQGALSYSLSFWMRIQINTTTGNTRIIGGFPSATAMRTYATNPANLLFIYADIGGVVRNSATGIDISGIVGTTQRMNVGFTFDYDGTNTRMYSYADGSLISTSPAYTGRLSSNSIMRLGEWNGNSFDGTVDEFYVFNRALTEDDFLVLNSVY